MPFGPLLAALAEIRDPRRPLLQLRELFAAHDLKTPAAIRLHRSGVDVRWDAAIGRRRSELAILTIAREYDQPYEWSLHEMEALSVGLEIVRVSPAGRGHSAGSGFRPRPTKSRAVPGSTAVVAPALIGAPSRRTTRTARRQRTPGRVQDGRVVKSGGPRRRRRPAAAPSWETDTTMTTDTMTTEPMTTTSGAVTRAMPERGTVLMPVAKLSPISQATISAVIACTVLT